MNRYIKLRIGNTNDSKIHLAMFEENTTDEEINKWARKACLEFLKSQNIGSLNELDKFWSSGGEISKEEFEKEIERYED